MSKFGITFTSAQVLLVNFSKSSKAVLFRSAKVSRSLVEVLDISDVSLVYFNAAEPRSHIGKKTPSARIKTITPTMVIKMGSSESLSLFN